MRILVQSDLLRNRKSLAASKVERGIITAGFINQEKLVYHGKPYPTQQVTVAWKISEQHLGK